VIAIKGYKLKGRRLVPCHGMAVASSARWRQRHWIVDPIDR
jgi:hypothetical protein